MDSILINQILEKSVKEKFHDYEFDLAIILEGLTSLCQPLDAMINKLVKTNLCEEWYQWMAAGGAGQITKEEFDNEIIDISDDNLKDASER
ncbi:pogo transposable element with KRAB domain-like [Rhizophagus clarus]|uniref:Pogo transposable element with KRAB domain-like n=1 Tax=Rhizophagus clarus TaxID=94130 RepID=A0A8H3KSV4_9GLOM|nr:pogo transposable element with KRAB domain-like [Rhizophagus clarus]